MKLGLSFQTYRKAFDKVWHEGLLLKLKANGIDGPLFLLIKDFLSERFQRVVLNGSKQASKEHLFVNACWVCGSYTADVGLRHYGLCPQSYL